MDGASGAATLTVTATEFKARCLDLLARVADGRMERLVVTRRGKPVAAVVSAAAGAAEERAALEAEIERGWEEMRGSVVVPPGFDLTAPVVDESEVEAARGLLGGRPHGG